MWDGKWLPLKKNSKIEKILKTLRFSPINIELNTLFQIYKQKRENQAKFLHTKYFTNSENFLKINLNIMQIFTPQNTNERKTFF